MASAQAGAGAIATPGRRCRPTYSISTEMSGCAPRRVSLRPLWRNRRAIIARSSTLAFSRPFYVGGLINSPGQKEFTTGMTLTQAILASGGAAREAGERARVTVARQGADGRLVSTDYSLQEIQAGKVPDPRIQAGDRIEVVKKR